MMKKLLKRLFNRGAKVTVVKLGKTYKFNKFSEAVAFMLA